MRMWTPPLDLCMKVVWHILDATRPKVMQQVAYVADIWLIPESSNSMP
jgi:hypothetical protein